MNANFCAGARPALFCLALFAAPTACNRSATKTPPPQAVPAAQEVVAMVGNQPITMAEIDKLAGRELYEVREKALDELITERVVGTAARAAGMSTDDYLRKQAEARVPLISVSEAKTWFEQNKARLPSGLGDKSFDDIKDMVVQGLTSDKRRDAMGTLVEEMKAKVGVKLLLRAPRVEVAAEGPSRGPKTAKVTIVEFSDFQCPFCSRGRKVVDEVVAHYGDKVRVVFRDFPLDFHDKAQKAAEASHCAEDQGKFWPMHDWMFDNQDKLDTDGLKTAARQIGLDSALFEKCLSSGQHSAEVQRHQHDGQKVGVRGTPAFFINGVMLSGAQPFEKFKTEIDRALND